MSEDKVQSERKPRVTIYTDGACSGNPGPGGWAAILIKGDTRKEISGGLSRTTNNRMELLAVIQALTALKKPCEVILYSDSKYVVDAFRLGWLNNWQKNNWKKPSDKKPVKNRDLWETLIAAAAPHEIKFAWVEGHADSEENNRCDELAVEASKAPNLPRDEGFEG